jgi:hypothetical protein
MLPGNNGYLAVCTDRAVEIYRYRKRVRVLPQSNIELVGWDRNRLLFRNENSLHFLDVGTGQVTSAPFPPIVVAIQTFPKGVLYVERHAADTVVTMRDMNNRQLHEWKVEANCANFPDLACIGKRYFLLQLSSRQGKEFIWILDTQTGTQKRFEYANFNMGFCSGNSQNELLIGLPNVYDKRTGSIKSSRFISVDLNTLRRHTLLLYPGELNLIGLSDDAAWLVTLKPYAEVGPGRLISIRISNAQAHTLQENVYLCSLLR